jgi:hypothetical protein
MGSHGSTVPSSHSCSIQGLGPPMAARAAEGRGRVRDMSGRSGCRAVPGVPCGMGGLGEGGWVRHREVLTCHRLWGHGHEGLWGQCLLLSRITLGR